MLMKNDEILHDIYLQHKAEDIIDAKELIDRGFIWTIYSGEKTINNLAIKTLIRYTYILFKNHKVKIWKL